MTITDTAVATPSTDGDIATDALVPIAMGVIAGAGGYASYLHAGLAGEIAAAVGLTLFTVLLLSHVLVRRRAYDAHRAISGTARVSRLGSGKPNRPAPPRPIRQPGNAPGKRPVNPFATQAGRTVDSTATSPAAATAGHARQNPAVAAKRPEPLGVEPPQQQTSDVLDALAQALRGAGVPQTGMPQTDRPAPDWAYRPGDRPIEQAPGPRRDAAPSAPALAELSPRPQGAAKDGGDEAVHDILNRLAAQIEGGNAEPSLAESGGKATRQDTGEALDAEVQALRATAETMRSDPRTAQRSEPGPSARGAPGEGVDAEPPVNAPPLNEAHARLGAIAEALARERLNVFVEPILGLADNSAAHFEISVRLQSPAGEALDDTQLAPAARGTGLLPLFDALKVRHSGAFAARLESRKRDGAVFSNVTGESLASDGFLLELAHRNNLGELMPGRLVLTFSQADVRGFAAAQWLTLASLREQGFRFALEEVTDLGMDLEYLVGAGFSFIKLDAEVFLRGLPLANALLPAADLCRYLAEIGLPMVVGRIDDEDVRVRVLGFGALYGQGALFGGARHIQLKPSAPQQGTAA